MALANFAMLQVRGKKNLVIEQSLAGPLGIFVKFSTLQEYGVDKVFFLENGNADTSQKNIVFIARGESAGHAQSIASTFLTLEPVYLDETFSMGSILDLVDDLFYPTKSCSSPK